MKLTAREKEIVGAVFPKADPLNATNKEIRAAYKRAHGHFWHEVDWERFVSINQLGIKQEFIYCCSDGKCYNCKSKNNFDIDIMRKEAKQWAKGKDKGEKDWASLESAIENDTEID